MKKIFTIISILVSLSVSAVTVSDVAGTFKGTLKIDDEEYPDEKIYILPGTESDKITFVLPNFKFNGAPLGDIVLVNVPMSSTGQLTINESTLYIQVLRTRATISSTGSTLSGSSAQIGLSISVASVPMPIPVTFTGSKVTSDNYAITNGGFEGNWSNNEPQGWHSFASATGDYASFVTSNTGQFTQQTDVRPGSTGSHSACIQSKSTLGVKANGNCTNGRINAGSMSATDASGNYAFSDPSSSGYNTPFVGCPDSLVFWAKYIPGGGSVTDSDNKARAHATLLTNARYQDPEVSDYSSVKIAEATANYSATSDKGWQRIAVPFVYTNVDPSKMAYMLLTFTTNQTPGGGNSTKKSPDNVYLDDAEMIYNHSLKSFTLDGTPVTFKNGKSETSLMFSDSEYTFAATGDGKASKTFIGYDAANSQVHVYVVADNYSQAGAYNVYTLQMTEPVYNTEYTYSATICQGEPYSDELFQNLTESGEYTTTIPNTQGGDSIITLTLTVLPAYLFPTDATIRMDETYEWRDRTFANLTPGVYTERDELKTKAGCDSIFVLNLTVEAISYAFEEEINACQNEETSWREKLLSTAQSGVFTVYDSLKTIYGADSIYSLHLTVSPTYVMEESMRQYEVDITWRGQEIKDLEPSDEPYIYYDSLVTVAGCDSVYVLKLYVSATPITYGQYEVVLCEGEDIEYEGVLYDESFEGDILLAEQNIYDGDSIVHLTVTVYPTYMVDDSLTIVEGESQIWEGWNLSTLPPGEMELMATEYTINDCDSTIVLHLTILPLESGVSNTTGNRPAQRVQKRLIDGQLYIIKEDEQFDILGKKVK